VLFTRKGKQTEGELTPSESRRDEPLAKLWQQGMSKGETWQSHPQQLKLEPMVRLERVRGRGKDKSSVKTESGLFTSYTFKLHSP